MTTVLHAAGDVRECTMCALRTKMWFGILGYSKFLLETPSAWTLANGVVLEWEAME